MQSHIFITNITPKNVNIFTDFPSPLVRSFHVQPVGIGYGSFLHIRYLRTTSKF